MWSLATVKYLAENVVKDKIDFAGIPLYASIFSLIKQQSYIDRVFAIKDWDCIRNGWIDFYENRWKPPERVEKKYKKVWHLTYRKHRCFDEEAVPAIDYIARQQGIKLSNPIPFIDVKHKAGKFVAWAFSQEDEERKMCFIERTKKLLPNVTFVRTDNLSWVEASLTIKNATCFIGSRSSNWVIAHAVGQKVLCFEPNPLRSVYGYCGEAVSCPYCEEFTIPISVSLQTSVEITAQEILRIING